MLQGIKIKKVIVLIGLIVFGISNCTVGNAQSVTIDQERQIQNILEEIIPEGWVIKTIANVRNPYRWEADEDVKGVTFEMSVDADRFKEWVKGQGEKRHQKLFIPMVRLTFMPAVYDGVEVPREKEQTYQISVFSAERLGEWNNLAIFGDRGGGYPIQNSSRETFWPFARDRICEAFSLQSTSDLKDYKIAIALAEELLPKLNLNPNDYKLIRMENLIIKGQDYLGPHLWKLTFKLERLIPQDTEGIIGAGGEVFIEVDMNTKKAKLLGYGE